MDSCLLSPRRPLRPRGLFGLSAAALGGTVLALPGLLAMGLIWLLVSAFGAAVVALPVAAATALDPLVGMVVAVLLGVATLPFALLWLVAGCGAVLALLASRTISAPLSSAEALGLGLRRALPLLGSALVIKGLGLLAMLPASFLAFTLALLGQAIGPDGGPAGPLLRALGLPLIAVAALGGLYLCFRLLWAPWSALLEAAGPLEAVERSWILSRGQAGRVLGLILTGLLLAAVSVWGLAFLTIGVQALQATALSGWLSGLATEAGASLNRLAAQLGGGGPLPLRDLADQPKLIGALLLALALPIASVCLVYAGLSAFYLDLLRRQEGFGARERTRPEPAALPDGTGQPMLAPIPPTDPADEAEAPDEPELSAAPPLDWHEAIPAERQAVQPGPPASLGDGGASGWGEGPQDAAAPPAEAPEAPPNPETTGPLDLGRIEGISLAKGSDGAAAPRKSRLAWLWNWLPEPERPDGD